MKSEEEKTFANIDICLNHKFRVLVAVSPSFQEYTIGLCFLYDDPRLLACGRLAQLVRAWV